MEAFNRHISSILKEFLSMVFFMVFIAPGKEEKIDIMEEKLIHVWYQDA